MLSERIRVIQNVGGCERMATTSDAPWSFGCSRWQNDAVYQRKPLSRGSVGYILQEPSQSRVRQVGDVARFIWEQCCRGEGKRLRAFCSHSSGSRGAGRTGLGLSPRCLSSTLEKAQGRDLQC